jgi:hypothetical protein
VQHERDPFGGSQPVEDHQQRQADRVGQQRLLLGVALALAVHDRAGLLRVQGLLAS